MSLNTVVKKNYITYFRNHVCLSSGLFVIFLFFLVLVLPVINFYGFGGKYFRLNKLLSICIWYLFAV